MGETKDLTASTDAPKETSQISNRQDDSVSTNHTKKPDEEGESKLNSSMLSDKAVNSAFSESTGTLEVDYTRKEPFKISFSDGRIDDASASTAITKESSETPVKLVNNTKGEKDIDDEFKDNMGSPDSRAESTNGDSPIRQSQSTTGDLLTRGLKHIKKKDGQPFTRKDIQHEFLEALFNDDRKVFTNYFSWCEIPNTVNSLKLTFSELYVRTMAESLKASKVLRDRLLKDPEMGKNVAKVCFLVNAGRINTTVIFLPDMRTTYRTYHPIPSLQSDHDGSRKPLQDTPRLKTILKAVCDGQEHLQTLLDVLRSPAPNKPNTNVIKLVFLLSQFFQLIPFHGEDSSRDQSTMQHLQDASSAPLPAGPQNKFMEFFMEDNICPKNRAERLLWLLYTYLETSFTAEELEQNPFNPGVIPPKKYLTDEETMACDIEPEPEIAYAKRMYDLRLSHLGDDSGQTNLKKGSRLMKDKIPIKKQLLNDGGLTSGSENPEDTVGEATLIDGNDALDEGDEAGRPNCVQRLVPDRKRKKPTPSLGSLVDIEQRSLVVEGKWRNPEFPIKNLSNIKKRVCGPTKASFVNLISNGTAQTISNRKRLVVKTLVSMAQLIEVTGDISEVRDGILKRMNRFFHYKKRSMGLLGIEWEDIRYELVNGVEAYLYQQLGKDLHSRQQNDVSEEDKSYGIEPEHVKRDQYPAMSDLELGDLAPVDLANLEKLGEGHIPEHDFNRVNERLAHEQAVFEIMGAVLLNTIKLKTVGSETCRFDLEMETMRFS